MISFCGERRKKTCCQHRSSIKKSPPHCCSFRPIIGICPSDIWKTHSAVVLLTSAQFYLPPLCSRMQFAFDSWRRRRNLCAAKRAPGRRAMSQDFITTESGPLLLLSCVSQCRNSSIVSPGRKAPPPPTACTSPLTGNFDSQQPPKKEATHRTTAVFALLCPPPLPFFRFICLFYGERNHRRPFAKEEKDI